MDSLPRFDIGSLPSFTMKRLPVLLTPMTVLWVIGLWIGYHVVYALYNISPLHPLWRFPGPKLAAASFLYEAYYDWGLGGRYAREIMKMHDQYGPLVRINPNELHCCDPYFDDVIYGSNSFKSVRDKWHHHVNFAAVGPLTTSVVLTLDHDTHRMRKAALSKYFSRKQIMQLESEVFDFARLTVDKMLRSAGKDPFDVRHAYNCFTSDVISQYCFGESMGFIEQDGWEPNLITWAQSLLKKSYMLRHNWIARKMTNVVPLIADYLSEEVRVAMRPLKVVIPKYVKEGLDNPHNGRLFADLVHSKALPPSERTIERLSGEGFAILVAGTETTTTTLSIITYYLLAQPEVYQKLMKDLDGIDPSDLKWTELEKRPYFWAVVHEALRMFPGASQRSARVAPREDVVYRSQDGKIEWFFPRGTAMSSSSIINHYNKDLYPNPEEFTPERWLVDGKPNYELRKMLLAFSKGPRSCLGENLALCEIYMIVAQLAFRVIPRAELYETTKEDIWYDHEMAVQQTKKGAIAVRIKIKE